MTGTLVDSNLLVYAIDPKDPVKREQAIQILTELGATRQGCLSVQSLSQFSSVVMRRPLLSAEDTSKHVDSFIGSWRLFDVTPPVVREALRCVREHHLNFWDAQIWAVAHLHEIEMVLSEDFQDGLLLEGVRFRNPFRRGFKLRI